MSEETKQKIAEALRGRKRPAEVGRKISLALTGGSLPKCESDCQCRKHTVSTETRQLLSSQRRGKRYGVPTEGYTSSEGYFILVSQQGHPLAARYPESTGLFGGDLPRGRKTLWDTLGCTSRECEHRCHWCSALLTWSGQDGICVDHLDGDRLNDCPENLVVSCRVCNLKRGEAGNPLVWSRRELNQLSK